MEEKIDKDKAGEKFSQETVVGCAVVPHTDLLMDALRVDVKDDHIFEGGGDSSLGSLHQQRAVQTWRGNTRRESVSDAVRSGGAAVRREEEMEVLSYLGP